MVAVNEVTIDVILNGKKAKMGLKEFSKELQKIGKLGKKTTSLFGKLVKIGGTAAFVKMTIDTAHFARSMGLLADRTGVAVSKLMGMRTAMSAMGGNARALDNLLGRISSGLAGLSMGDGETASKLAAMNISAWGAGGKVKSADEIFGDMADWTKRQLDSGRSVAEVFRYLSQNFGVSEDEFQALRLGKGGWEAKQAELTAKTGVMDDRQVNNLIEFNKTIAELTTTVKTLWQQISGDVAPVFKFLGDLLQYFVRGLQDVWKDLSDVYKDVIGNGEEVSELFNALKTGLGAVIDTLKFLVKYIIGPILYAFRVLGEWIGNLVAFLEEKLGWFFSSPREKERRRDAELATEAFKHGNTTEERLKWLSEQGSLYWKEQYDNYLDQKDAVPVYWADGTPLDGSEVMKADGSSGTFINLEINNEANIDPNGSIVQTTDVNGEGVGSGGESISSMWTFRTVDGGHY